MQFYVDSGSKGALLCRKARGLTGIMDNQLLCFARLAHAVAPRFAA